MEAILAQCPPKQYDDPCPPFNKSCTVQGTGCYLVTQNQTIPIIVHSAQDIHDKLSQISKEYTLLLYGQVLSRDFDTSVLSRGCHIMVHAKDIKQVKASHQTTSDTTPSLQHLSSNKAFLKDLKSTIQSHTSASDCEVVFQHLKLALEKLK